MKALPLRTVVCALLLTAATQAHAHAVLLQNDAPPLTEYFRLGVEHILSGCDHLTFLLGVVLIANRTTQVLAAVTAFTLAHSLTLALAVLGFATVSPRIVEPLIALSVAYVGLENFWNRDASRRYRLTFAFGLVHGFGFAGALAEIGLPGDRAPAALASFNLGVEAGQLLVFSALWPLLIWLRRRREHAYVTFSRLVSVVIVALGFAWAIERSIGGEPAIATDTNATSDHAPLQSSSQPPQPASDTAPSIAPSDVRPVYGKAKISPLAERVCHFTQRYPREQRAQCGGEPVGVVFDDQCTRMLSAALASGAIKPAEGLDGRCVNAIEARYATCDFMQFKSLPPIAACTDLWEGQLADGAVCRSSLECRRGSHCHGVSSSETGVCGAPKAAGASCGNAIDALASYVPNSEADHPECSGRCVQGRCL
jgi:hydrogenase/urease accessory protein HupE